MEISVIIPLYNKRERILIALNSVLNQTFLPSEIIIINDGSTDGSELVVMGIDNPKIKLINQGNQGVSAARNRGVKESKGDWIAFLDADDFWEIDFLETIFKLHKLFSDAKVLITKYKYFYDGKIIYPKINFEQDEGLIKNYFKIANAGSPPIWTGAICVKKKSLIEVDLFPTQVKIGEDLLTWARLSSEFDIAYSADYKSNYYFPLQIGIDHTFRLPDKVDFVGDELKLMLRNTKRKEIKDDLVKYISNWHKIRLHLYAHHSLKKDSVYEFILCVIYNPFNYKAFLILIFAFLPRVIKKLILRNISSFK